MKIETKIKGMISLVASIVENQISYSCLNLQRIIANVYALLNDKQSNWPMIIFSGCKYMFVFIIWAVDFIQSEQDTSD